MICNYYEKYILKALVASYDRRKNQSKQSVKICIKNDKVLSEINGLHFLEWARAAENLQNLGFISIVMDGDMYRYICLNRDRYHDICKYASLEDKESRIENYKTFLTESCSDNDIWERFRRDELEKVSRYDGSQEFKYSKESLEFLENVWKGIEAVTSNTEVLYRREFSTNVYHDSKTLETGTLLPTILNILYQYGHYEEFDNKEDILEYHHIIKNPYQIYIKGSGTIFTENGKIALSDLPYGISLNGVDVERITKIECRGVFSVENLTSYHRYSDTEHLVLYLGGYVSDYQISFLKKIKSLKDIPFYHFGDIDSGGFWILSGLSSKLNKEVIPYKMGITELKRYTCKKLTENDKSRLLSLLEKDWFPYKDTVRYMLLNDCKLEQENITET